MNYAVAYAIQKGIISATEAVEICRKHDNDQFTITDVVCNLAQHKGYKFFEEDCLEYFREQFD